MSERERAPSRRDRLMAQAVARAELLRSRRAVFGSDVHPEAALFASTLARAVAESPVPAEIAGPVDEAAATPPAVPATRVRVDAGSGCDADTDPTSVRVAELPPLWGRGDTPIRFVPRGPVGWPEIVALPNAPALVCDRSERVVRANAALLRLAGRSSAAGAADGGLFGMRLPQIVVGPDVDARLVRADGDLVRVRVVRWEVPDRELQAVVLVELGEAGGTEAGRAADRRWIAELERLARVGTRAYELANASLTRSDTLEELYRSVGISDAGQWWESQAGPVEGDQVALLCQALRSGRDTRDHHVDLRLPGERVLSCRAEVEHAADGTPVRLVGVVRDVGAQRQVEGRARHSGRRFADLMELSPAGVAVVDAAGWVLDANTALCELLDVPMEQLRGTAAVELAAESPADPLTPTAPLPDWLHDVPPGAAHGYRLEQVPLRRGDGTTVWCELAASVTTADDGGRLWLVVVQDVGELRRAAELLRSAGTVDELTRLPNRTAVLALLDRLLAGPGADRLAVVCGGLDGFQRVNSSLGYEAGDDLLVAAAARLQRELPFGCTAARLAGDEFVVVCADHGEVGGPHMLARVVADLLHATIPVHGQPVHLTASVGLALPVPDVRGADLLRFAEVAMHDAKRRQLRGGIGVATDGVVNSATEALELEAELSAAIAGNGLTLAFQPVVGPDGTVLSAEALVRWPHPERGPLSPADFLPIAQRSGLLRDLDLWVLRAAAREAATWTSHRGYRPAVAVNLAGLLPGDPEFLSAVTETVRDSGLAWHQLVLELVETSLVALPSHALAAMAELVHRGVRFAVDDFGTGFSSLSRLKELPAQIVKVDRAFVTGVGTDPADLAVARAVVDMAHAMGRYTVAEGVETAQQFEALRGIGVDAYQGWLFSAALPAPALRELLAGDRPTIPASGP